ncbi:MAG: SDR family oxidoreductase [Planctomycetota bacterium]|jgi:NAD(P)-dependent dehydrogenase (short-subunit alcohol dehydrogenase family)
MANTGGIFITGASSGIGEACALDLDKRGYHVIAGVRREKDGESLSQRASKRLLPVIIDIADREQVKAAAETVRQALGEKPLVGLINNAGISVGGPLEFTPIDRLRHQLEINVISQVSVTQLFIPLLRKSQGRIINVGSVAGIFASPMMGPYCASKYAMEAISDVMRRELKPWKIRVSLLEPGIIATKIWGKARNRAEQAIKNSPEGLMRLYQPLIEKIMMRAAESEENAQSPDVVVKAVVHALTSARPKTRYRMGPKASAQKVISWLPDTIQDRLVASFLNWGK